MHEEAVRLPLTGMRLPDVGTGETVALDELRGVTVLTLLRHRY